MPLQFKCPHCGQPTELPDKAINRMARCTSCHNTYAVRSAIQTPSDVITRSSDSSIREKLILSIGLGVPALAFIVFLVYWFGFRDTWETDNFVLINDKCEAVLSAVRDGDDISAESAYLSLETLLGDREIERDSLIYSIKRARQAYVPVGDRLEILRKEREAALLAREREQKAREQAIENARLAQLEATKREQALQLTQGNIRWDMVDKARKSWQDNDLRNASLEDQIAVMIVIQVGIEKAVTNIQDREATLDYIQEHIDSW